MAMKHSPEVESLRAQLKAAEKREAEAAKAALAAITTNLIHEYEIIWHSKYVFTCMRKVPASAIAAFAQWRKDNSTVSYYPPWHHESEGMSYVLIDNMLVMVGGGTLVLKSKPDEITDTFSHEPRALTADEAAALRSGIVPDSLKL